MKINFYDEHCIIRKSDKQENTYLLTSNLNGEVKTLGECKITDWTTKKLKNINLSISFEPISTKIISYIYIEPKFRKKGYGHWFLNSIITKENIAYAELPLLKEILGLLNSVSFRLIYYSIEDQNLIWTSEESVLSNQFARNLPNIIKTKLNNISMPDVCMLMIISSVNIIVKSFSVESLNFLLNAFDLERIKLFISVGIHESLINDLWGTLSLLYFRKDFTDIKLESRSVEKPILAPFQAAALLGVGLQKKSIEQIADEYNLPTEQILIHFKIAIKKIYDYLINVKYIKMHHKIESIIYETRQDIDKLVSN